MVEQWAEAGGGLPTVAAPGRNLIQFLYYSHGRPSVATLPTS